jgi:hypothetical protein
VPHLPVRFTKAGLIGLLAYAALPASYAPAQEISQPRIIEDPKLAACINHLGQNMVDDIAEAPLVFKIEVSDVAASDQEAKIVSDPDMAACIDLLARNLIQSGTAKVPFVIRATPER